VREDPVLPDSKRTAAGDLVPTSVDRVLQHLHALHHVVCSTRERIVLSAPHVNLERTEREPSSLFIEVGAALGRPEIGTSARKSVVPDLQSLRRDAFVPSRESARSFQADAPVGQAAWLRRASARNEIPPAWTGDARFDLSRIENLRAGHSPNVTLGQDGASPVLPGVTPEKPVSASALQSLLGCPRGFLYERVLKWSDPAGAPSLREVEQPTYGSLFHEAMETFYCAHGPAFVAHERALAHWQRVAAKAADECFERFLSTYPLVGDGLRRKELERLHDDVRSVVRYDWDLPGKRTFVDVERAFGVEKPVSLKTAGGTLYLQGYIDRLDVEGDHTLVRDLKTGNAHPRTGDEADAAPGRDLQLAVYGLVVKKLAREWGVPAKIQAAYVYPRHRGDPERAFRGDYAELERAGASWLELASRMLHERLFPPTPVADDCAYCVFRHVCGPEATARAAEMLEDATGTLAAFRDFKLGEQDE
jgi:RecB family exonuclease